MKLILAVTIFAVATLVGQCKGDEDEDFPVCRRNDIDGYADDVLKKSRKELPDPIRLPPRSTFVELSDGVAWGLSNLTRVGHAHAVCIDGHTIIVKTTITTDELKGRYTWKKEKKGKDAKEGYVVFISHDFASEIDIEITKKEGEVTHPRLVRFEIRKFKDAKVEITGMGFFSWALGEMTTLFSGVFQRSIAHAVQGPLKEALERVLREINVECAQGLDFSHFCNEE